MRPCVVVVEDEIDLLQVLHDMLDVEGINSIGVGRPELVLPVAQRNSPHVFLIDMMLPGASGIEVARDLQEHGFAATPMIAMSASDTMVRVARESGLFHVTVAKPFDFDALFGHVRRLAAVDDDRQDPFSLRGSMAT